MSEIPNLETASFWISEGTRKQKQHFIELLKMARDTHNANPVLTADQVLTVIIDSLEGTYANKSE